MLEVNKWWLCYFNFTRVSYREESGRKGARKGANGMRNKTGSVQKCHPLDISLPGSVFPPCLSCFPQLSLLEWWGYSGKAWPFFLFSFEAAWRSRITHLKVTWFVLKCAATRSFGDCAFYGDTIAFVRLFDCVQCGGAEIEIGEKCTKGRRHYTKRLLTAFSKWHTSLKVTGDNKKIPHETDLLSFSMQTFLTYPVPGSLYGAAGTKWWIIPGPCPWGAHCSAADRWLSTQL